MTEYTPTISRRMTRNFALIHLARLALQSAARGAPLAVMRVTVRTLRQGWSAEIDVPAKCTVGTLRRLAAKAADISPPANAKLVLRGAPLADDAEVASLKPGDTLLVAVAPPAPVRVDAERSSPAAIPAARRRPAPTRRDGDDSDDDDALPAPVDASTLRPAARALVAALRRARVPEPAISLAIAVPTRAWVGVGLWLAMCRLSHSADLGPVFVICSGIFAIFAFGLGKRKPGEWSAYSIFNEGVRELPGTFNAGAVDNHIRRRME